MCVSLMCVCEREREREKEKEKETICGLFSTLDVPESEVWSVRGS